MMTFLDEINVSGEVVKFWKGFDLESVLNHPKDGKNGFMIVLIDSVEEIRTKIQRDMKLDSLFNKSKLKDFDDLLENLDNSYLMLYQSRGEDELIVKILKDKFSKTQEWQPIQGITKKVHL